MTLKFVVPALKGELAKAMEEHYKPIATAATAAMVETAEDIKDRARADIAAAGFGKRWQNALRVDTFPKRGVSAGPAALVYHRIPYADVFEAGASIRGKPTLWVPLQGTPKKIGRERMTPKLFVQQVGPLIPIQGGRNPLLAAKVALSKTAAKSKEPKLSLAALRRGAAGNGVIKAVPLFVGVPSVTVRDRFSINEIVDKAAGQLVSSYARNFRTD